MKPTVSQHHARALATAQALFREVRGDIAYAQREADIAALPAVDWHGQTLRTVRCHGVTGRGEHDQNLPLVMLWSLVDLNRYRCPFHA